MKRSEIINQLLNEGFTAKTLLNFNDKQLLSLSNRINESLTVSQKTLDTDPNTKMKVDNMAKTTDVKIVPEGGVPGLKAKVVKETGVPGLKAKVVKETGVPGLKAKEVKEEGVPGLKAKVVKETGVPGLKAKVVKETGVPGLKAKEVKEEGVPGLKAKVVKETGVPGLKAKVVKETGVPGLKAKEVKEEGVPGLKAKVVKETGVPGLTAKKEVKEAAGAMPGLTVGGKKTSTNPVAKSSSKPEKEVDENDGDNDADDKKEGKVSKKQAFLDMIKKKKENKSINEWVDDVAQKHYRPFTTKNDIMEMIMTKLDEVEEIEVNEAEVETLPKFLKYQAIKGSGAAPAPAEPKTRPGTKTPPKQNPNERPKTPYRPGPGINPAPKAGIKSTGGVTPKTMPKA